MTSLPRGLVLPCRVGRRRQRAHGPGDAGSAAAAHPSTPHAGQCAMEPASLSVEKRKKMSVDALELRLSSKPYC